MCGIIGYTGSKQASDILLQGLERLEYRGYDSAGIAVYHSGAIGLRKTCGRVEALKDICCESPLEGTAGIGHTRWATHGEANTLNSHPHTNLTGTIAVVHNGIIENHEKLRAFLQDKGYRFVSQTDTEVIPHLVDYYYRECYDFLGAVRCAAADFEGSYAIGVICSDCPGKIIALSRRSPLVVGLGKGENFISSDINALSDKTDKMYVLDSGEMAVITAEGVSIFDKQGEAIEKDVYHAEPASGFADKGSYEHYMLKEIYQQPHVLHQMISTNVFRDKRTSFANLDYNDIKGVNKIYIIGCGTAYHAALVGKYIIEHYAKIPVEADVASEFRYRKPIIDSGTLFVAITQSGETADTLAAMSLAKEKGAKVIAVTNTPRSTATRQADFTFLTTAGAEVSVASTKAYTAQLAALYIFAMFLADSRGEDEGISVLKNSLLRLPKDVTAALALEGELKELAGSISGAEHLYYIGRGLDFVTAAEGALKMKEITYIHAESYAAGELKHGPIALLDEGTMVVCVSTDDELHPKTAANMSEVISRGAKLLCFSPFGEETAHKTIKLPEVHGSVSPFVAIVPLQLLSYYTALARGCDVDKPRNLAKSVTVE